MSSVAPAPVARPPVGLPFAAARTFAAFVAAIDLRPRLALLYATVPNLGPGGYEDAPTRERPRFADVRRCLLWLAEEERTLRFSSSYGLKHCVEQWAREIDPKANAYTPNGAMVVALLLAGWEVERRGPNAIVARRREGNPNHKAGRGEAARSGAVPRRSLANPGGPVPANGSCYDELS